MSHKRFSTSFLLVSILLTVSCAGGQAGLTPAADMPNPASVYCEENGGTLELRQDASSSVAGFCRFSDGSECEEWSFFRAECRPGDSLATVEPTPGANLPNPASVYCEENGGTLEIRQDAMGGVSGVCHFDDGSECDEWAYFRGECGPGDSLATPSAEAELAPDGWLIYRHATLGYTFHYPADAALGTADDPLHALTITGPLVDGDNWPMIYISHPGDRPDYRPPEGVDLEQWLTDQNLLMVPEQPPGETRQPDREIGGTLAIHTRLARSPQTYAYDRYYFAHSGQLFNIVILHTDDREDWTLYDRFLDSFQFEAQRAAAPFASMG